MPKPIANARPFTGDLIGEYLLALQAGVSTDNPGLDQMTKVKLSVLRNYILQGVAPALHPVSQSGSTLPENPANGDYFFADTTFTVSGKTYTQGHMYTWDGTEWKDTTDIFSQYALQSQVDDLQMKVDALDGLNFKGSITEAQLEQITPSSENKGWMYYVSDLGAYKASDGTAWVTVIDYVTQTVESGNTTEAPSSDAVYQMKTELEAQIVNNSQRLTNVEQAVLGKDLQIDTDDTQANVKSIVKANLLPYAILKRVGARSVPFNQLCPTRTLNFTARGLTITSSNNGTINISGTTDSTGVFDIMSDVGSTYNGHVYCIALSLTVNSGSSPSSSTYGFRYGDSMGSFKYEDYVVTASATVLNSQDFMMTIYATGVAVNITIKPMFFDLTAMNEASLTAAQFRAKFPASYYPPTTGQMIDLPPTSFKVIGTNQWDEEWESGLYNQTTGEKQANGNYGRSKNLISVIPNESYYFKVPTSYGQVMYIAEFDASGNYIGYSAGLNSAVQMPSNCVSIGIYMYGWTSNNHDIQICLNSVTDKTTCHPYSEQIIDTSFMAGTKYVNPSCYDYSENVYEDGLLKRKDHIVVRQVDLGDWYWEYQATNQYFYSYVSDMKVVESAGTRPNFQCANYEVVNAVGNNGWANVANMSIGTRQTTNYICIKNTSKTAADLVNGHASWLEGVMLVYELATPTTSLHNDPIPNLEVEDGSTVWAITPQTELVNAIDVPSTIYIESKITA